MIEAVLRESSDLEIFDDYVAFGRERLHQSLTLGMDEIDRHRALAAVGRKKIRRLAALASVAGSRVRRSVSPGVVADHGLFNLDDAGAKIGQCLSRPRPGENAGEFQNPDMLQRPSHRLLPLVARGTTSPWPWPPATSP